MIDWYWLFPAFFLGLCMTAGVAAGIDQGKAFSGCIVGGLIAIVIVMATYGTVQMLQ